MSERPDKEMSQYIQPDGNLYSLSPWISFRIGDDYANLDADFTPSQLRWIADYIESKAQTR